MIFIGTCAGLTVYLSTLYLVEAYRVLYDAVLLEVQTLTEVDGTESKTSVCPSPKRQAELIQH